MLNMSPPVDRTVGQGRCLQSSGRGPIGKVTTFPKQPHLSIAISITRITTLTRLQMTLQIFVDMSGASRNQPSTRARSMLWELPQPFVTPYPTPRPISMAPRRPLHFSTKFARRSCIIPSIKGLRHGKRKPRQCPDTWQTIL